MILRYNCNFPAGETRWNLGGLQDVYALTSAEIPDGSARDSISCTEYVYDENTSSPRKW